MDLQVLAVIAGVFLASLFSLLFIYKFFRSKTFEEVAAEKKLLAEKIYGPSKPKKQNRKVPNKKGKEKKMKPSSVQQVKETDQDSQNESDGQSDSQSAESSPSHKKQHVEFLEPEVISDVDLAAIAQKRASIGSKQAKRKNSNTKSPGTGILVNKSEPVVVKDTMTVESLNSFDLRPPKDVLEMKRASRDETNIEATKVAVKPPPPKETKKNKANKKDVEKSGEANQSQEPPVAKEVKSLDEKAAKPAADSPKGQNHKLNKKKKIENSILEKLDSSDSIGVNSLMILLNRAELTRNEIQILIDYLLNKQQDTVANHSDWSDDIVQKLRKQLNEKEKALQEEQEASAGIQAKLRELRTEINTERVHYNANTKIYFEDIQSKKSEILNLNQEIQTLNEKFNIERQQYQAKIRHEKQSNSQEFLAQIQQLNDRENILQNEIVQKTAIINELQLIAQAARQTEEDTKQELNKIIQQQNNQIMALEKNFGEAEKKLARQHMDLEMAKIVEKDKDNNKVEIRNLQNALDSTKSELSLSRNECNDEKQRTVILTAQIDEIKAQLGLVNNKYLEQSQQTNELNTLMSNMKASIAEKDGKLADYEMQLKNLTYRENELTKQIQEQKEKNNFQPDPSSKGRIDEQKIRELMQRLFPEATSALAGSALSLSFDQWVEQVAMNVKHQTEQQISNKCREFSENFSNNHSIPSSTKTTTSKATETTNPTTNTASTTTATAATNNHENNSSDNINSNVDEIVKNTQLENAKLRAQIDELKSLATKTANVLTSLETKARDQDAHWRSVVQSKDEEINALKNSNGQAI